MKPYKIVDNLDKHEFIKLVEDGQTVFYKDYNHTSFMIVNVDNEKFTQFIKTDQNDVLISSSIHALYRLFNLWQIGELL